MKLLKSPTFYTIGAALVGAVSTCVLLYFTQIWLAILSGSITVLLVILSVIAQAYQHHIEENRQYFLALAQTGQHVPGLIDYCLDNIKLWWKRRHPTCKDCRKSIKRSKAAWLYAPTSEWNDTLQEMECTHMWLCFICIERRLREMANQAHLSSASIQHWKTTAEQLQAQIENLENEPVAKRRNSSHNLRKESFNLKQEDN